MPFDNAPTCEATLREVHKHDMDDVQDLERAVLSVVSIDGDRATARLEVPDGGPNYDFTLVKTDAVGASTTRTRCRRATTSCGS